MTTKHFIALADLILKSRATNANTFRQGEVRELAEFCKSQNPRFDTNQFFAYIDGKGSKTKSNH